MSERPTWQTPEAAFLRWGEMVLALYGDVVLPTIYYDAAWWSSYNGDGISPGFEDRVDAPTLVMTLSIARRDATEAQHGRPIV